MIHTWPLRDKLFAFVIALLFSTAALQSSPIADAAGLTCGGQNWPQRDPVHSMAPTSCVKTTIIDGITVHVGVSETGPGFLTVKYTLDQPLAFDALVHVVSHLNASDSGGPQTDPLTKLKAGHLTITLTISQALCGQVDIRFLHDNKSGRVVGPWINNQSCQSVVTTTTSTTVPPSTTSSTIPPGSTTTSPGPHETSVSSTPVLPPTGNGPASGPVGWFVALGVLGGGVLLVLVSRRRVSA